MALADAEAACEGQFNACNQTVAERDLTILYLRHGDFDIDSDVDGNDLARFSHHIGEIDIDVDDDSDGYSEIWGDCDDNNILVNPDDEEICYDDIDNNCNGLVDEGCPAGAQ